MALVGHHSQTGGSMEEEVVVVVALAVPEVLVLVLDRTSDIG
jgi:hypothetical protein